MNVHKSAGQPASSRELVDIPQLITAYHEGKPDPSAPDQLIQFGTSGHRGSSLSRSFNRSHILAISQALCDYRTETKIRGPLFLGKDTHALSEPALLTALEVFAENGVEVRIQTGLRYTPTPLISHAILKFNREHGGELADGVVITPSHNPPEDGGYKYNPPQGGPAGPEVTDTVQARANQLLKGGLRGVKRRPAARALKAQTTREYDFLGPYLDDLETVLDMSAIAAAKLKIGVDPLGGSSLDLWEPLADRYRLDLQVVNRRLDPTFAFMTLDKDGRIRMDCSSRYAMAGLIELKDDFDIAFGNDPDADRFGIVSPRVGLMNPNHFLCAAVWYLFQNRPDWLENSAVGKTLVSTSLLDRIADFLGREAMEVPVGFKWFVPGLLDGSLGFAGEESAGASFLKKDGTVWTTDKDGILMDLLACEITACWGKDPAQVYKELEERFGRPAYTRIDAPATPAQKAAMKKLTPAAVKNTRLAGEEITMVLSRAPGNQAPIGGLKVATASAWFAARPSGTENIYKIYAESFRGKAHLEDVLEEAQALVSGVLDEQGAGGS